MHAMTRARGERKAKAMRPALRLPLPRVNLTTRLAHRTTSARMATPEAVAAAVDAACKSRGGAYALYSCKSVSWEDASRGTVGGGLSCWGSNITDVRLYAKDARTLFTVRTDNW